MSDTITISPPAPQPVRVTIELTPEQTDALLQAVLPAFALPEGIAPSMLQSIAAHRAATDGVCSLDLVFNPSWGEQEEE